jgi:hypothetical protein
LVPVIDGFQAKAWPVAIVCRVVGVAITSREP